MDKETWVFYAFIEPRLGYVFTNMTSDIGKGTIDYKIYTHKRYIVYQTLVVISFMLLSSNFQENIKYIPKAFKTHKLFIRDTYIERGLQLNFPRSNRNFRQT